MLIATSIKELEKELYDLKLLVNAKLAKLEQYPDLAGIICLVGTHIDGDAISYNYAVHRNENNFEVSEYRAVLRSIPPIDHGIYEGIDTRELEAKLAIIDWNQKKREPYQYDDPYFLAVRDVDTLSESADKNIQTIGHHLQLKYWSGTLTGRILGLETLALKYEKKMTFPLYPGLNCISGDKAYQLLKGRAIVNLEQPGIDPIEAPWLLIESEKLVQIKPFNIQQKLRELPLSAPLDLLDEVILLEQLCNGQRIGIELSIGGKKSQVSIEADPRYATIAVYNDNHERIVFPQKPKIKQENTEQSNKKEKRKPGKGPKR